MSPSYPHLLALTNSQIQSAHIPQGLLGAAVVWAVAMAVIWVVLKIFAAMFGRL